MLQTVLVVNEKQCRCSPNLSERMYDIYALNPESAIRLTVPLCMPLLVLY